MFKYIQNFNKQQIIFEIENHKLNGIRMSYHDFL